MASYRVSTGSGTDSQGEEFRKYLENGGVLNVITRIITEMYQKDASERPENPLEYFKSRIGVIDFNYTDYECLSNEVDHLSEQLTKLKEENTLLKKKLAEAKKGSKD